MTSIFDAIMQTRTSLRSEPRLASQAGGYGRSFSEPAETTALDSLGIDKSGSIWY
jgi:hypothetical protein